MNVYNEDDKPIGLLVSSSMTAREACHKLVLLNKAEDDPQWALVEHLTDLGLGEYPKALPKPKKGKLNENF